MMNQQSNQNPISAVKQRAIALGWRYAIFAIAVTVIQLCASKLVQTYVKDLSQVNQGNYTFLLVILSVDIIGFPLIYLLTKKIPAPKSEKHSMSFGNLIICILMNAGLVGIGTVIGLIVHFSLTLPFGTDVESLNTLGNMMLEANPVLRILTVGILAPIFEELIFRKLLIDRMKPYSELAAILMSGLMFGLFHGNFQQFFFAALLGFFFAFVYSKTGKIWYTILFHMVINLSSSVVTIYLLQKMQKATAGIDTSLSPEEIGMNYMSALPATLLMLGWLLLLASASITGIILLIVYKKKFKVAALTDTMQNNVATEINDSEVDTDVNQDIAAAPKRGTVAKSALNNWGIWLFYIICIGLFLYSYVPGIIAFIM